MRDMHGRCCWCWTASASANRRRSPMAARLHDAAAKRSETVPARHETALPSQRLCTPIPIQQIMVPLSGTPRSRHVLPYAVAIAEATGAGLSLVWVQSREDRPVAGIAETSPLDYLAETRRQLGLRVSRVRTQLIRGAKALRGCVDAECTEA